MYTVALYSLARFYVLSNVDNVKKSKQKSLLSAILIVMKI